MRVLLVEDDVETGRGLRLLLANRGHDVHQKSTGLEELISQDWDWSAYDVLVCDLVLSSEVTGVHVLMAAHLANPDLRRVVLSAAPAAQLDALRPFADALLRKPSPVEAVIDAIEGGQQ